jgi:selenocysteine lyase/cysteine desulfurase
VGLALELKEILSVERIERVEQRLLARARERFAKVPGILVLGDARADRLGILSVVFDEGRLHYNLAARMLSDRWGIQTRGGCMCAGTYGHELLGIGAARSFEIKCGIEQGDATMRPGWTRISLSPATSEEEMQVLLDAVEELARHWRDWAVDYTMDATTGSWRHRGDHAAALNNRPLKLVPADADWSL